MCNITQNNPYIKVLPTFICGTAVGSSTPILSCPTNHQATHLVRTLTSHPLGWRKDANHFNWHPGVDCLSKLQKESAVPRGRRAPNHVVKHIVAIWSCAFLKKNSVTLKDIKEFIMKNIYWIMSLYYLQERPFLYFIFPHKLSSCGP